MSEKIQINLNSPFLNSDGTENDSKQTLARVLSGFLDTEGDNTNPVKLYGWSKKLNKDSILELDDADYSMLKQMLETTKRQIVLARAQILLAMIDAKDNKDKPDSKS